MTRPDPQMTDAKLQRLVDTFAELHSKEPSFTYRETLAFLAELQERRANDPTWNKT